MIFTAHGSDRVLRSPSQPPCDTRFFRALATGLRTSQTNALQQKSYWNYDLLGRMTNTLGDVPYPVSNRYDAWGRMTNMATYRGGSGWSGPSWPGTPGKADET